MSDTQNNKTVEKSVGAVWIRQTSSGQDYLSFKIVGKDNKEHNFVAFANKFKEEGDNKPIYNIFLSNRPGNGTESATPTPKKVVTKKVTTAVTEPAVDSEF